MTSGSETPPRAVGQTGFGLVAVAAALWGTDALFRQGLATELPAAAVVFAEHVLLVLLCAPLWPRAWRAVRGFTRRDWAAVVLIGAGASAGATALFTAAFRYGDPTTPLLLQKLQPLVAVIGARLVLGERLRPRFAIYFTIALLGAYLVSFPSPLDVTVNQLAPALLASGAASLWGMGTVLGRGLTARVDTATLTALRFIVGMPAAGVILALTEGAGGFVTYTWSDAAGLLLLALIPGLLSLLLYYRGLARTPAAAATLAELAFPLTAIVVNYVAFGAALTITQTTGIAVLSITVTALSLASHRRGAEPFGVQLAPETTTV